MDKLLMTPHEAKAAIGCGSTKLYELLTAGKLRARKLGKALRIEAASVREFVESLPVPRMNTRSHHRRTAGKPEDRQPAG